MLSVLYGRSGMCNIYDGLILSWPLVVDESGMMKESRGLWSHELAYNLCDFLLQRILNAHTDSEQERDCREISEEEVYE